MVEAAANNELAHTVYNDLGPDPWQCSCGAWNPDGEPCNYIPVWKGPGSKAKQIIPGAKPKRHARRKEDKDVRNKKQIKIEYWNR